MDAVWATLVSLLILGVGLRNAWLGLQGVRGRFDPRPRWLREPGPEHQAVSEEWGRILDVGARVSLWMRLFFGLILIGLGTFGLAQGIFR